MRRIAHVIGIMGIAAGLVLVPVLPAMAHNYVVSSTPAEDETLAQVPEFFVITTNENMLDLGGAGGGFAIQVTDENGFFYGDGCVTTVGPSMSMPGALGAAGEYTMTYQFVSADGHTLSDSHAFTFAPTGENIAQPGADNPPVCGVEAAPDGTDTTATATTDAAGDESSAAVGVAAAVAGGLALLGVIVAMLVRRGRHRPEAGN